MRVRSLVLVIGLLITSFVPAFTVASAPLSPTPFARESFGDCPLSPPWAISHDTLSGSYIGNGWQYGFLMVFQLTAIGGSVQGYLIQSEVDDQGTQTQETYSVSGLYDDRQVSLRVSMFLSELTMIGTWNDTYMELSYVGSSGDVSSNWFSAIGDSDALELLDAWNDRGPRLDAQQRAITALDSAFALIPFNYDIADQPAWIPADQTARQLGMPGEDSLSLLSFEWLASAGFAVRPDGNLPNSLNRYSLHLSRSAAGTRQLAACLMQTLNPHEAIEVIDDYPELDLLLVQQVTGAEYLEESTTVIAVAGRALIMITAYGSLEVRETAVTSALDIRRAVDV